ncbi:poly [ADP-ribose] polymerase 2-like [Gouania willdenowi]|uniref:poly [ADP-ribose] polymerase 2-like n=1 Tax=Gouania willdenowi TaxID=441366 RepID=UPI0010567201|nr:poly [ADP-ribose] polymerase 2-like [Gouania willdenowi]
MRRTRGSTAKTKKAAESEEEVPSDAITVWQWKGDQGQWETYSSEASALLDSAVSAGETSVTLDLGSGTDYEVDLKKMFQINPVTKYKRKIRTHAVKPESVNEAVAVAKDEQPAQIKEEEVEAEEQPPTKRRKGQGKKQTTAEKKPKEESTSEEVVKTVVMKGKAPVDSECKAKLGKAHIYSEGNDVFDVMLNQTNLQFNNNKYYLIQLLEDDNAKSYSVWARWGRVGKVGQNSLTACGGDLLQAKNVFKKKFLDKTKNEWDERDQFEKVAGKYDMVFMDYSANEEEEKKKTTVDAAPTEKISKLDVKVRSLLELICDIKAMEECVLEMKFDIQKAPLGKLTTEQIRAGYEALKLIEDCLKKKKSGNKALVEACNLFYTRIPHNFGLKTPPLISTEVHLKEKMALLEALSDIQIAVKMVQSGQDSDEHPVDRHYHSLQCKLEPLDPSGSNYKIIDKYLQSTHASTHNYYTMTLVDCFSVDREGENDNFLSQLHNKTLLWHGSRLSNWVGILSKGLRVAPPESPVTGYMFGKGIYFADMSSKSANYCFTNESNSTGLLLLCEVALGDANELLHADYDANNLPAGKHCTKGLGQTGPDPKNSVTLDGATVPLGPGVKTGVGKNSSYSLLYNEFIVYNPAQVRLKYLLRVKFNY